MSQTWHRIERRDASGAVVDWVEVGRCAACGRGVDREFPREYRDLQGVLYCRPCAGKPLATVKSASPRGPGAGAV